MGSRNDHYDLQSSEKSITSYTGKQKIVSLSKIVTLSLHLLRVWIANHLPLSSSCLSGCHQAPPHRDLYTMLKCVGGRERITSKTRKAVKKSVLSFSGVQMRVVLGTQWMGWGYHLWYSAEHSIERTDYHTASQLVSGGRKHACLVRDTGIVWAWGTIEHLQSDTIISSGKVPLTIEFPRTPASCRRSNTAMHCLRLLASWIYAYYLHYPHDYWG